MLWMQKDSNDNMKTLTARFEELVKDKETIHLLIQEVRNSDALIVLKHPKNIDELIKFMEERYV